MGADLTGLDIGMITPGHVSGVVFADKNAMVCATRMKAACSARWFT